MAELISMTTAEKYVGSIPAYPDPNGFVADDGTPARIGSVPRWELMTPGVGSVTVDADGMTNLEILSPDMAVDDPPLTNQLKMTVDIDVGAGEEMLELFWDLAFTALAGPRAARLGATFLGSVVPK